MGDYICQALGEGKAELENESATIKVRAQPYIDDFGLDSLSHTGKSATVTDGDRLVLTCHIRDPTVPVTIAWLRSELPDDERVMVDLAEVDARNGGQAQAPASGAGQLTDGPAPSELLVPTYTSAANLVVERVDNFTKRLIIESVGPEHRGYYTCMVGNGVTANSRKTIFIRVKDKIIALWPFLGILAELFILFTIIYVWETQRAQKALTASAAKASAARQATTTPAKRPASGPSSAFENMPLNR